MACFLVPAGAAIVTTVVKKKVPKKYRFNLLNTMLWGGVVMSVVDHIINGEVVFYPPFLTADLSQSLPEMLRVGVPMTLSIFLIWGIAVMIGVSKSKKAEYIEA
jgi:hypothetical protein